MTMHLARGLSTINTKKRNTKLTKSRMIELQESWRKHNKDMKRHGLHSMRYEKFEDYLDYCFGRIKPKSNKKTATIATTNPYIDQRIAEHREKYKSAPMNTAGNGCCHKVEPMKYTGTLIKGIATMHKSNAVPIIDDEQAKDIARMRRG